MNRSVRRLGVSVPVLAVGAALAVALGGCGGGSSSTAGAATTTTTTPAAATPAGGAAGRAFPGASGSVAAITGSSMEVQNPQSGQVTVSWTKSTAFTETVKVGATSVVAGDCVSAVGTLSKGKVTATTVTVSRASSGQCDRGGRFGGFGSGGVGGGGFVGGRGGAGGRSGSRPKGGSTPPSSGARSGFPGGGNFAIASGKVTSVSKDTLVISGFSTSGLTTRPTAGSKTKTKPTTVKVGVTTSTTYSETKRTKSSHLAVGDCVTAGGKSNSTGAVKATTVRITSTGHKSCTTGFTGGFGPGAARGGSTAGGSTGA
jgi:hypothetical protein